MLTDHRRAFRFALALLACLVFMLVAVGRHPEELAPLTTLAVHRRVRRHGRRWADDMRVGALTGLFTFLSIVGGGLVTIPLRIRGRVLAARSAGVGWRSRPSC